MAGKSQVCKIARFLIAILQKERIVAIKRTHGFSFLKIWVLRWNQSHSAYGFTCSAYDGGILLQEPFSKLDKRMLPKTVKTIELSFKNFLL
jgi:hypothetical protein